MNIYWLKNDLRLEDNTALIKAISHSFEEKENLIIIFQIDVNLIKDKGYSYDYFFLALYKFRSSLRDLGLDIKFIYGDVEESFIKLLKVLKVNKLFYNLSERGYGKKRDLLVSNLLKKRGVDIYSFYDKYVHSSEDILKNDVGTYKIFTPYYKKWSYFTDFSPLKIDKVKFKKVFINLKENTYMRYSLDKFEEIIKEIKSRYSIDKIEKFKIGENEALLALKNFKKYNLIDYDKNRDIVIRETSNMSQYLSSGEISPRQILEEIKNTNSENKNLYIRQLAWRDFFNMVYHYKDNLREKEAIPKYRNIKWNYDKELFYKWANGQTGYPIVDAAMRKLKESGRMHNRLRMISASFLVKDLLIDWRMGEEYFKKMLIDYDSASNICNWQWAASVGYDAVPYFRIFNPSLQSKKFDKDGEFIKENIEELKNIPKEFIHEPYKNKEKLKNQFGIEIEKLYMETIVNHKEMRSIVMDMYKNVGEEIDKKY
ncbi:MAG: cryptochrome/photolyase family protein [Peptoniphilaceae bacterium]